MDAAEHFFHAQVIPIHGGSPFVHLPRKALAQAQADAGKVFADGKFKPRHVLRQCVVGGCEPAGYAFLLQQNT